MLRHVAVYIAPRGVWGVGRRAKRSRPEPHRQDNPTMCNPTPPCPSIHHQHSSLLSGPPGHTTTLVPHRQPHTVFHPTLQVPVLDHPYSKLWAGGQGRQAQRRRGTRIATNRLAEPTTGAGLGPELTQTLAHPPTTLATPTGAFCGVVAIECFFKARETRRRDLLSKHRLRSRRGAPVSLRASAQSSVGLLQCAYRPSPVRGERSLRSSLTYRNPPVDLAALSRWSSDHTT
jgi:hypothetical protein